MRCDVPIADIYIGKGNVMKYALKDGCVALNDLSAITRVVIDIGSVSVDSSVVGDTVIWWDDQIDDYQGSTEDGTSVIDVVSARLGEQSIPEGIYYYGKITVYDPENPLGIVWDSNLKVEVQ